MCGWAGVEGYLFGLERVVIVLTLRPLGSASLIGIYVLLLVALSGTFT